MLIASNSVCISTIAACTFEEVVFPVGVKEISTAFPVTERLLISDCNSSKAA